MTEEEMICDIVYPYWNQIKDNKFIKGMYKPMLEQYKKDRNKENLSAVEEGLFIAVFLDQPWGDVEFSPAAKIIKEKYNE